MSVITLRVKNTGQSVDFLPETVVKVIRDRPMLETPIRSLATNAVQELSIVRPHIHAPEVRVISAALRSHRSAAE